METTNDFLAVRTVCGQVFAWYPSDKFPSNPQADVSVARSWNVTYRNRWPSHVVLVTDLVTSVNGIATDGRQVNIPSVLRLHLELNGIDSVGLNDCGRIE